MRISQPTAKSIHTQPLKLFTITTLLISSLISGCGGSSGSSGGGGTTPPPPPSTANEWTWMGGSSTANAPAFMAQRVLLPLQTSRGVGMMLSLGLTVVAISGSLEDWEQMCTGVEGSATSGSLAQLQTPGPG